jgi:hypothetical protein
MVQSNLAQPKYHKRGWLVKEAVDRAGLLPANHVCDI